MKAQSNPKLDIPLTASVRLNIFYAIIFVVIMITVVVTPLDNVVRIALFVSTLISARFVSRQLQFLRSVQSIHSREEGLSLAVNGRRIAVKVVGNSMVSEFMTVFSCRPIDAEGLAGSRPMHLVILSDSASAEDRRLLRLLLKQQG